MKQELDVKVDQVKQDMDQIKDDVDEMKDETKLEERLRMFETRRSGATVESQCY